MLPNQTNRRLIYYVVTSLDGFIAHPDGSFDGFAWDDAVVADFLASYDWFDTVLMGRKTYEVGLAEGKTSPYPTLHQYVFSRSLKTRPDPAIALISKHALEVIKNLKTQPGKAIWLCGGSNLTSQCLAANLIDDMIIKLNPVVVGSGKLLFADLVPSAHLTLGDIKRYDCGILRLHYTVQPALHSRE